MVRRVGVVGFGHLGKYLTECILERNDLELAFVWNRTIEAVEGKVEDRYICKDLEDFASYKPDIVIEVAHPSISLKYGPSFLSFCDFMIGSPTALANQDLEDALRQAASKHGLYVPAGALWGAQDIAKMAHRGTLKSLKVTMKKHPSAFRLDSPLKELNDEVTTSLVVLYEGPVRPLCPLAPNNVNTMAAAALAAHNLGFDNVQGCLLSDPNLHDRHIVLVDAIGPNKNGLDFQVRTERINPSDKDSVTGSATYASFLSSLLRACNQGPGLHLC